MNYRERIRKAIECPQFGNETYGEWGALNLEQRKYRKRLLNELDSADNCVKKLYLENQKQKKRIDKAIECLELWEIPKCDKSTMRGIQFSANKQNVLDILKGNQNE